MKKCILSMLICIGVLLAACNLPQEPEVSEAGQTQLLMIYMVGSDLESEAGMASRDLTEMMNSDFVEENMQVLLCTGGTDYWWTDGISNEDCEIHRITDGSLELLHTMSGTNMAEPETLTEFIDYCYENYPADYYSMILWDHGGGAVLGFGADEIHDYDSLSLEELDQAFQATKLVTTGERFSWVGFDACLMAMVEVANVMADYSDYLIASEEMEAGEGWNYACLKTLSDGTHYEGMDAAEEILNAYSTYYENNYQYTPDYTMACLDLSHIQEVVLAWENLIAVADKELHNNGYSKIAKMRDQAKSFGKISASGFYDTVDLYDITEKMAAAYPEQADDLQSALDELVVQLATNVYGANGVAVYFPYDNKEYAGEWVEAYESTGFSAEYTEFLKTFTNTLSGKRLADWELARISRRENQETPGEYYVQLTKEQYENFGHAKYSVWEEDSPGSYICWITSTDVTITEDGKLSSDFEGKQFFLSNSEGNSLPCCVAEIERNEQYTKYAIPIIITPGEESFAMNAAYIHFRVSDEHPEGEVIGIYEHLNTESSLFPNRDVVDLRAGDIISPFYFAADIVFNEDGSVGPYEEWTSTSGVGDSFVVTDELKISLQNPKGDSKYCCLFEVVDTQGNSAFTNPIYVEY